MEVNEKTKKVICVILRKRSDVGKIRSTHVYNTTCFYAVAIEDKLNKLYMQYVKTRYTINF